MVLSVAYLSHGSEWVLSHGAECSIPESWQSVGFKSWQGVSIPESWRWVGSERADAVGRHLQPGSQSRQLCASLSRTHYWNRTGIPRHLRQSMCAGRTVSSALCTAWHAAMILSRQHHSCHLLSPTHRQTHTDRQFLHMNHYKTIAKRIILLR